MSELQLSFDFEPREWQKKVFALQKRYTVLAVHRRAGKTTLAVAELILKALQTNGLYAYIAPELKQARLIAWDLLKQMVRQFQQVRNGKQTISLVDIHETEPYVQFWNGSRIMLFGADKPDRLRGTKLAGAIIDEVAQMPREMWSEIVRPALMDSKGWALFIGTPKGMNLFSELYDYGNKFQDWACATFTCYETDALDPAEIEAYKREVSAEEFKREMLCDFTASASNQLINLFTAQQAAAKSINPHFLGNVPLVLGVDVARFGDDRSVLCFRKGLLAEEPIIYKNTRLDELAGIVKRHVDERRPRAVFVDGTGMGCGVVDCLNSLGVFCYDINFGARANDRLYFNKRTEMWCKMARWLDRGGIIPQNNDLVQELALPTYEVNDNMQKVLESKTRIRERAGKSPDCFVAGTMVTTPTGITPIEEVVKYSKVLTPYGEAEVLKIWRTKAHVLSVIELDDGTVLKGKPDHKVFTWNRGLVRLADLTPDDELETNSAWNFIKWQHLKRSYTRDTRTGFKQQAIIMKTATPMHPRDFFTGSYTKSITAQFLKGMTSTIKTAIGLITDLPTWKQSQQESMTTFLVRSTKAIAEEKDIPITKQEKAEVTNSMTEAKRKAPRNQAPFYVLLKRKLKAVSGRVKVVSKYTSYSDAGVLTYNLTLDRDNVYYANGVLVENCADALALTFAEDIGDELPPRFAEETGTFEYTPPQTRVQETSPFANFRLERLRNRMRFYR